MQIKGFILIDFFRITRPIRYVSTWSVRTRWKDSTFFIMDCVLKRRWAKALPVFAKYNWLSCVACSAGRNENRESFSTGVKSTAYIRCSCTVYDFLLSVGFVNKKWCCWLVADTMMRLQRSNLNVCFFTIKWIVSAPVAPYVTCDKNVRPSL